MQCLSEEQRLRSMYLSGVDVDEKFVRYTGHDPAAKAGGHQRG